MQSLNTLSRDVSVKSVYINNTNYYNIEYVRISRIFRHDNTVFKYDGIIIIMKVLQGIAITCLKQTILVNSILFLFQETCNALY